MTLLTSAQVPTSASTSASGSTPALASGTGSDRFDVQATLQGLYDEISQATLQFATGSDVDLFHQVLYTPDWVFVDATGRTQTWPQVRQAALDALSVPYPDSMVQSIQKLSLMPDGATAVVHVITTRAVVDNEGRYGRKGASHILTEASTFRDRWILGADDWKAKSREQIGQPVVSVDKPDRGM
jgi:hypothetical protein